MSQDSSSSGRYPRVVHHLPHNAVPEDLFRSGSESSIDQGDFHLNYEANRASHGSIPSMPSRRSRKTERFVSERRQTSRDYLSQSNSFPIVITGMTGIVNSNGGKDIHVEMVKEGEAIIFSWQGFRGTLNQSGYPSLDIQQSFPNLPNRNMVYPIVLSHRGVIKQGLLTIEPYDSNQVVQIKFYINLDRSGDKLNTADSVEIYPSAVSWICSS